MKKNEITVLITALYILTASCFAGVKINGAGTEYAAITSAVNNAVNGDVLIVTTGLYVEAVDIYGKDISIDGKYNFDYTTKATGKTIIHPPLFYGSCIDFSNSVVELIDIGLTGSSFFWPGNGGGLDLRYGSTVIANKCVIYNHTDSVYGGGVYVDNSSLTLTNTPVYDNYAAFGGGIYATNSQITLSGNSSVHNNTAKYTGGGICLVNNSQCNVIHSGADIKYNYAPEGGGVSANNSDFIIANKADLWENSAATRGGGILLVNNASATIYDFGTSIGYYTSGHGPNIVTNGNGGAIYAADSTVTISNLARVASNYASKCGGGIYLTNSTALIENAQIGYPNTAVTNFAYYGGGIYMLDSSLVVTNGSIIQRGLAGYGGGIYSMNSTLGIYDNSIIGNANPGFANMAGAGAGLFCEGSTVRFDNIQIIGNLANAAAGAGFIKTNDIYIANSSINNNISHSDGGGIYAANTFGQFILDNTEVVSNLTLNFGGGIRWNSVAALNVRNGSRICDNVSSNVVGAVHMDKPGSLLFQNSEISGNMAMNSVGGIASVANGKISLVDCIVNNNNGDAKGTTNGVGGGIYIYGGSLDILASNSFCTIISNSAAAAGGIYAITARLSIKALPGMLCKINGNSALQNGGGILCANAATATISGNVSIDMNSAYNGAGIYVSNNCAVSLFPDNGKAPVLRNNYASKIGGGICSLGPDTTINLTNVLLQNNTAFAGAGITPYEQAELTAINCKFIDNKANLYGGAIYAGNAKIIIDSDFNIAPPTIFPPTIFQGNSANMVGGIHAIAKVDLYIANAMFVSNSADTAYGAIAIASSTGKLVNVIIADNNGQGIADGIALGSNHLLELQNCTIVNNYSNGVHQSILGSPASLQNCIVWGHLGEQVSTNATAVFCDIQGGFSGPFNITNDPLFVNPAELDFQVLGGSASIDSGMTLISVTNDCIGEARPYDGAWDMGAYEFIPEPGMIFIGFSLIALYFRRK